MSTLMRSINPISSWTWIVEHEEGVDTFEAGAPVIIDVLTVLQRFDVFQPSGIIVEWSEVGTGVLSMRSHLTGLAELTPESLGQRVWETRPIAYKHAEPIILKLSGTGVWFRGDGRTRTEPELLGFLFDVVSEDTMVEVSVHHDIWAENDFYGIPHPDTHSYNAPRLSKVLTAIADKFGTEAESYDSTYMGTPFNYGVRAPIAATGRPLDVTGQL